MEFDMFLRICLPVLLMTGFEHITGVNSSSVHRQLLDDLFGEDRYHRLMRPVQDESNAVDVTMQLVLTDITAVEEMNHQVELNVWIRLVWKDVYLKWNSSDYGHKEFVIISSDMIWIPDVTLYNSIGESDRLEENPARIMVHSDGSIRWSQRSTLRFFCQMILTSFPFDEQLCVLRFGSWSFDGSLLNLKIPSKGAALDIQSEYNDNGEWNLLSANAYRKVNNYTLPSNASDITDSKIMTWPEIYFSLNLKRKHNFYLLTLLIPYFLISALSGLVFLLQPDSGEKMGLAITTLLSLVVFNEYVMEIVPPSADYFPMLSEYFLFMMFWVGMCVVISSWVLHIYHQDPKDCRRMPRWLRIIIFGIMGRAMFWCDFHRKNVDPSEEDGDSNKRKRLPPIEMVADDDKMTEKLGVFCVKTNDEGEDSLPPIPGENNALTTLELEVYKIRQFLVDGKEAEETQEVAEAPLREWRDAARIVDQFFFWFYTITNVFLVVVFTLKSVAQSSHDHVNGRDH